MADRIYLDNNASTIVDPRVAKVMHEHLMAITGNPSSIHSFGQECRRAIVKARNTIAAFLKVKSHEIIFCSGGTEALNMLIRGVMGAAEPGHIISTDLEHSAVYNTVLDLEKEGSELTLIKPGLCGAATVSDVKNSIKKTTRLIVLMAANNETGVKTDIEGIAALAKESKIPFVVDAVSLMGKDPFTIVDGVSAYAFSGHKFHAPRGIGFAYIKQNLKLKPLIVGGGHEYQRRSGTENTVGIVGIGKAVSLIAEELPAAHQVMTALRDYFELNIMERINDVTINGEGPRIGNTSNLSFGGVEGESLLMNLDLEGIAVSHGSACHSGTLEPSRVLLNMGIEKSLAETSIRFSLSRFTTKDEVDRAIDLICSLVTRLRAIVTRC